MKKCNDLRMKLLDWDKKKKTDDEEEKFLFFTGEHSNQTTASIMLKKHAEEYIKRIALATER